MRNTDQYDVFLSHNNCDKSVAEKLALGLKDEGLKVWNTPGGAQWEQEIQEALEKSNSCVVLLGPNGWGEDHLRETRRALSHQKTHPGFRVIPILLPNASKQDMQNEFKKIQWIGFKEGFYNQDTITFLVAAINGDRPISEGRPNLSYLLIRNAQLWELSHRKDQSILYRGKQLREVLEDNDLFLQLANFLQASQKQMVADFLQASQKRKKRHRRWIILSICLLLFVPYLWIGFSYYLSTSRTTSGTTRIVVRLGHPGLKVLSGFDFSGISTGYDIYDLDDPSAVSDERLNGFWFQKHNGYHYWGKQLYSQLKDHLAGLAYWRAGDRSEALGRLESGVVSGDRESIQMLGYIAMQDEEVVGPAVDTLAAALQGDDELHDEALTALGVIRDTHPEVAAAKLAEMANRFSEADESQSVIFSEAVNVLSNTKGSVAQQTLSKLIIILRTTENDQIRLRIARALGNIIPGNPEVFPVILPEIAEVIRENQGEVRQVFLKILVASTDLDQDSLEMALETTTASLEDDDKTTRLAVADAFGKLLVNYPSLSDDYYTPILLSMLADPFSEVRKSVLETLASLPTVNQALSDVAVAAALEDNSSIVRISAIDMLSSPRVLVLACNDLDTRVRQKAIQKLSELSLRQPLEGIAVESVFLNYLNDTSSDVRLEAAIALLLIADHLESDLTPAYEVLVRYLLSDWYDLDYAKQLITHLPDASVDSVLIFTQGLLRHITQEDDFRDQRILDFILLIVRIQPAVVKDVVLMLDDNLLYDLWRLDNLPSEYLSETLDALAERLESSMEIERKRSAAALGWLRTNDEVLAAKATSELEPILSDLSSDVRVQTVVSLGMIGRDYPTAIEPVLEKLLSCLDDEDIIVRQACAEALVDISENDNAPEEMISRLVTALTDSDAEIRLNAADALANFADQVPLKAVDLLSELAATASSPRERLKYASALGLIARDDPEKAIRILTPLVSNSSIHTRISTRISAIIELGDIGKSSESSAEIALKAIEPVLYYSDEAITDFEYITMNVIASIVRHQPSSSALALSILLEYSHSNVWLNDKSSEYLLSDDLWNTLVDVYAVLGADDIDIHWPQISSRNGIARRFGREALLHVIIKNPEIIPDVLERLDRYATDSRRPLVRQSAAIAEEMIQIVLRTEEYLIFPEMTARWLEILGRLPDVGIGMAENYSMQKIRDSQNEGVVYATNTSDMVPLGWTLRIFSQKELTQLRQKNFMWALLARHFFKKFKAISFKPRSLLFPYGKRIRTSVYCSYAIGEIAHCCRTQNISLLPPLTLSWSHNSLDRCPRTSSSSINAPRTHYPTHGLCRPC